jgi:hypothetical protein
MSFLPNLFIRAELGEEVGSQRSTQQVDYYAETNMALQPNTQPAATPRQPRTDILDIKQRLRKHSAAGRLLVRWSIPISDSRLADQVQRQADVVAVLPM